MKIWLDDLRPMPIGFDIHCKTSNDAINLIQKGFVTHISFDHDLGEDDTGYKVAFFIEKNAFFNKISPLSWEIHSANPVGKNNIEMAMRNAEKFWKIGT